MKILYATDLCGVHDFRLIAAMRQAGHEVLVLTYLADLDRKEFVESGFDIRAIDGVRIENRTDLPLPGRVNMVRRVAHFRRTYRAYRPDIVHAVWLNGMGFLATLAGAFPLAVFAVGSDALVDPFQSVRLKLITRYVVARAQAIWDNSHAMREALVKAAGHPAKNHVIHLGIDAAFFVPSNDREGAKAELGWTGRTVLMQNRTFRPVYGYPTLFDAVARLRADHPNILLAAGGVGPQESALRGLASRLGIEENVTWPGYVPPARTRLMLHGCDVYVNSSFSDSCPASMLEAIAAGKAIVASRAGGNGEWIDHGKNGLLVEAGEVDGLAEGIRRLIEDRPLREAFEKENALHRRASTDFQVYFPQLMKLYETVIAEAGA